MKDKIFLETLPGEIKQLEVNSDDSDAPLSEFWCVGRPAIRLIAEN